MSRASSRSPRCSESAWAQRTQSAREGAGDGAPAAEVVEVASRREAIRRAVALAGPGDVVLVAGKGRETGQEVAGVVHPFDDRDELRAALAELAPATGSGRRRSPEHTR